jgi:hypothetical protein
MHRVSRSAAAGDGEDSAPRPLIVRRSETAVLAVLQTCLGL